LKTYLVVGEGSYRHSGREKLRQVLLTTLKIHSSSQCLQKLITISEPSGKYIFTHCSGDVISTHEDNRNIATKQSPFCLFLIKHHDVVTYWGVEVQISTFLTATLGTVEWPAARSGGVISGKKKIKTYTTLMFLKVL
jgi:hypothetical protein